MKVMFWIVGVLAVLYLGACTAAYGFRNQLIFYPDATQIELPAGALAQLIEILTEDGERLVALYTPAVGSCPTVLNFHGNAQHLSGLVGLTEAYAGEGIGFLAVAYRGYSGSTGRPSEAGVRTDARAALAYLNAQGVPGDRIVLRGFSLGSSVAIGLAAETDIAALVLGAPMESGTRLGGEKLPFLPVGLLAGDMLRSDRLAGNIDRPVLIIHGDADRIIPPEHSLDLAEHFPGEVKRVVFAGRGHNDLQAPPFEALVLDFLSPLFTDCTALQERLS